MKYGLYSLNFGTCADPEAAVRVAQHAEDAGFESVWVGEHVVLPNPRPDWFTMAPNLAFLDSIAAMTLLATHTKLINVGCAIFELPLHHPVRLAKQLASLDIISNCRVIAGVGAGYLAPEFAAMGVPLDERATRTDEYIDAMRALWTMPEPEFIGHHVRIRGVDAYPRPRTPNGPPILIGGLSAAARRRAIRRGQGWFPYDITVEQAAEMVAALERESIELERNPALGPARLTVIPAGPFDAEIARQFADVGVDRIVLLPTADAPTDNPHAPVPVEQILSRIDSLQAQLGL